MTDDLYDKAVNHFKRSNRFENDNLVNQSKSGPQRYKREVIGYSWRSACARCELPPQMNNTRIMVIFTMNILFSIVLWGGVIYKAVNDSTLDYLQHFTNWMWTFAAVYYTLDAIAIIMSTRFFEFVLLYTLWWIYFANVWVVFWLVFIMLYDNPGILTDEFEDNGGDYYAGTVLVANQVFHYIPPVYAAFYLGLRVPDFIDIYYITMVPTDSVSKWSDKVRAIHLSGSFAIYILVVLFAACGPIMIYYNAFDINEVYEVDTNVWVGMLVIFSTIVVSTVGPISLLSPLGVRSQEHGRDTWSMSPNVPSERDKTEFRNDVDRTARMRKKYSQGSS
jgi:hypothetical protein